MSETMRMWVEVSFNVLYLLVVWGLVIAMWRKLPGLSKENRPLAQRFYWAFGLLALGDTGHVGSRVIGYLSGNLGSVVQVFDRSISVVGLGALATAVTVTFFYVLMLDGWRLRFNQQVGWIGYLLIAAAIVRLIIMAFPQNQWGIIIPPLKWSLYRNIPLIVQGLGIGLLILHDSIQRKDRLFWWISMMIFLSYICYMPVIFWVQQYPMIGMLMIPKTLAYLGIAILAYRGLFTSARLDNQKTISK